MTSRAPRGWLAGDDEVVYSTVSNDRIWIGHGGIEVAGSSVRETAGLGVFVLDGEFRQSCIVGVSPVSPVGRDRSQHFCVRKGPDHSPLAHPSLTARSVGYGDAEVYDCTGSRADRRLDPVSERGWCAQVAPHAGQQLFPLARGDSDGMNHVGTSPNRRKANQATNPLCPGPETTQTWGE